MIQERVRTTGLARNRFLAYAGTALVAAAVQAWFPGRAEAAAPNGCYGAVGCPCCTGNKCCAPECVATNDCSGKHCWRTCAYEGGYYYGFYCCDYQGRIGSSLQRCICRENWGSC